jgi:TRAP-type C4-dicarboxylate transport system permease small subunit
VAGKNQHLAIDLLPNSLTGVNKQWLNTGIHALIAIFAILVLIVGGTNLMIITMSLGQVSAALNMPLWILYAILPFSGLVMLVYSVLNIFDDWEAS